MRTKVQYLFFELEFVSIYFFVFFTSHHVDVGSLLNLLLNNVIVSASECTHMKHVAYFRCTLLLLHTYNLIENKMHLE